MQFGAMEPKSVMARKLNELVSRVKELEAIVAGKAEDAQATSAPAKKRGKKTDVDAADTAQVEPEDPDATE